MVTKLYLHDAARSGGSGTYPSGEQSALTPTLTWTGATTLKSMNRAIGAGVVSQSMASGTVTTHSDFIRFFCSDALQIASQTVGGGAVTLNIGSTQGGTTQNFVINRVELYIWRPSTNAKVGTILAASTVPNTAASPSTNTGAATVDQNVWTSSTAVTANKGDVIVCEVWATYTKVATSATLLAYYDGTTENTTENATTSNHAAYLQLTQDLAFLSDLPNTPTTSAATQVGSVRFVAQFASGGGPAQGFYLDVSADNFVTFVPGYNNLDVGNVTSQMVTGLTGGTTYSYRVRAYNYGLISSSSSPATQVTTAPAPFHPFDLDNCVLLLVPENISATGGNGTPVATWYDVSNQYNHLAQATAGKRPVVVWNGTPIAHSTVRFDPANQQDLGLATQVGMDGLQWSAFILAKPAQVTAQAAVLTVGAYDGGGRAINQATNPARIGLHRSNVAVVTEGSTTDIVPGQWYVFCATSTNIGPYDHRIYLQNNLEGFSAANFSWANGNGVYLGSKFNDRFFSGDIAAVVYYSYVLPDPDRLKVYNWLMNTYINLRLLGGVIAGQSAVQASLGVTKPLAGHVAGQSAISGSVTPTRNIAGRVAGQSSMGAALAAGKNLSGVVAGASTLKAGLSTTKLLGGRVGGQSTIAAALLRGVQVRGTVSGQSALGASVVASKALQGTIVGKGSLTGVLALTKLLSGSVHGQSSIVASMGVPRPIAGQITGRGALAVQLAMGKQLSGTLVGQSHLATAIAVTHILRGSIAGQSNLAAVLSLTRLLSAQLQGQSSFHASLGVLGTVSLSGHMAGQSSLVVGLSLTKRLGGSIAGHSAIVGAASEVLVLRGQVAGHGAFAGALGLSYALSGQVAGHGTFAAPLRLGKYVSGHISGAGALSANMGGVRMLGGLIAGQSLMRAGVLVGAPLRGTIAGHSAMSAGLALEKLLYGQIMGQSSLAASLIGQVNLGGQIMGQSDWSAYLRQTIHMLSFQPGILVYQIAEGTFRLSLVEGYFGLAIPEAVDGLLVPEGWFGLAMQEGTFTLTIESED